MFKCFKRSFIKSYYFYKIKRRLISLFYYLNILIPKDKNKIVAFVDFEKIDNKLVPYKNDNVYLLSEYIKSYNKNISIVYIPSNQFGGKSKNTLNKKVYYFIQRLRSKVLLFKQPPHLSDFFTKQQYLVCLGYFIPFKADYWDFKQWQIFYAQIFNDGIDIKNCSEYKERVLEHFTYKKRQFKRTNLTYITPSHYSSKVLAKSHNLPINSFKVLGFPKGDLPQKCKYINLNTFYNLDFTPKAVIFYTPTFRDIYIRKSFDDVDVIDRTVFGYQNEKEKLEDFLVENDILIIIKLHKSFSFYREMEKYLMHDDKSYFQNCYFLDFETEAEHDISVYDLFAYSDAMIADYSSISFDYLPFNKPIIYNIPDIKEYRAYRGFSYEPIEEMMAGDRVYTIDGLKEVMLRVANGEDNYIKERKRVLAAVNETPKGKSLKKIYSYIEGILS